MTKRDAQLPDKVKERDNNTCVKCGRKPGYTNGTVAHHIIPLAYDGPDTIENMATLCTHCDKFVPEDGIDREWYEPVFDDYISTKVCPEVDLACFGSNIVVGAEAIRKIYEIVAETERNLEDAHESTKQPYFWLTLACGAGFGSVREAIDWDGVPSKAFGFAEENPQTWDKHFGEYQEQYPDVSTEEAQE